VDTAETIALGRYLWPRLFAVVLLGALVFFPKPTYGLIEAEAKHRAREYTALLIEALFPEARSQGDKPTAGHRDRPTDEQLIYRATASASSE
jgi:hypothetical protein